MRIGINLLFLIPNKVGGSETFVRGLIDALPKYDTANEYILFCNNENYPTFKPSKNIRTVRVPIDASRKILRILYEQSVFPFFIKNYNLDILHSLGYVSPLFVFSKSIVNIIDLNWYYHPEDFGVIERFVWKFLVTNSAKRADAITTISQSSKKSIQSVFDINQKPVEVVYMGEPPMYKPITKKSLIALGVRLPYIFSLTSAHPHKNIMGLLKVYKEVADKGYKLNLVIAGLGGRSQGEVRDFIKKHWLSNKIKILGYVSNEAMIALYKYSKAFVFTSKYEGFGIPILESFQLGVPVVSSNAFSLKEVVGNGGVQIDPEDTNKFSSQIIKIISDVKYRNMMAKKSLSRKNAFSWEREIKKLKKLYLRVYED